MSDSYSLIYMGFLLLVAVTLALGGLPILLPIVAVGSWLESRAKTKRILAEARLQEAKNAARQREPQP